MGITGVVWARGRWWRRYVILGDGCMMEGISNEASSLAGHWGLGKLIALYDDNKISIDGHTEISFTEDVGKRYEALGWHVIHVKDGNTDYDAIRKAIADAKAVTDKPTLIKVTLTATPRPCGAVLGGMGVAGDAATPRAVVCGRLRRCRR